MEIPKPVISKVEETIFAYFDADAPKNGLSSSGYQQLFNRTKHVLEYLLRSNQDRLMQGLYRIDVQEEKVKKAFALGSLPEIATELAVLIINREMQKIELREKYRTNN